MILCIVLYAVILAVSIYFAIREGESVLVFFGVAGGFFIFILLGAVLRFASPLYPVFETQHSLIVYEEDLLFKNTQDQAMSVSSTNFEKTVYSSEVEKPYVLEIRKENKKTWYRIKNTGVEYILYLPAR